MCVVCVRRQHMCLVEPLRDGCTAAGEPDSACEHEEVEALPAVSLLELFYDLVFVVAIHDVASGLEVEGPLWPTPSVLFVLRMYLIWSVWHRSAGYANLASQIHSRHLDALHFAFLFVLMGCMSFMARATKSNDNRTLLILYAVVLWVLTLGVSIDTMRATGEHRSFMRTMLKLTLPLTVVETALSGLCAYLAGKKGTALSAACAWNWAALASVFLGTRTLSSLVACARPHAIPPTAFDEEHFGERYTLVMLIFLGEVVAAGGAAGGLNEGDGVDGVAEPTLMATVGMPLAAIATAFQCFLLAFVATPAARRNPWACGMVSAVHAPHAFFVMACALAAMGPAFSRLIEAAHHEAITPEGAHPPLDVCASVALLHLSVGLFLLSAAVVHVLGADKPAARARCAAKLRAAALALAGGLLCLLVLLPGCDAGRTAALIPLGLAPLTIFALWASSSSPKRAVPAGGRARVQHAGGTRGTPSEVRSIG